MTDDVSNLRPDFDEAGLLEVAGYLDNVADAWNTNTAHPPRLALKLADRALVVRNAIKAHDKLRERCLMAETRERLLLTRLSQLERQ